MLDDGGLSPNPVPAVINPHVTIGPLI